MFEKYICSLQKSFVMKSVKSYVENGEIKQKEGMKRSGRSIWSLEKVICMKSVKIEVEKSRKIGKPYKTI